MIGDFDMKLTHKRAKQYQNANKKTGLCRVTKSGSHRSYRWVQSTGFEACKRCTLVFLRRR